jgi:hypothetical protein
MCFPLLLQLTSRGLSTSPAQNRLTSAQPTWWPT